MAAWYGTHDTDVYTRCSMLEHPTCPSPGGFRLDEACHGPSESLSDAGSGACLATSRSIASGPRTGTPPAAEWRSHSSSDALPTDRRRIEGTSLPFWSRDSHWSNEACRSIEDDVKGLVSLPGADFGRIGHSSSDTLVTDRRRSEDDWHVFWWQIFGKWTRHYNLYGAEAR